MQDENRTRRESVTPQITDVTESADVDALIKQVITLRKLQYLEAAATHAESTKLFTRDAVRMHQVGDDRGLCENLDMALLAAEQASKALECAGYPAEVTS